MPEENQTNQVHTILLGAGQIQVTVSKHDLKTNWDASRNIVLVPEVPLENCLTLPMMAAIMMANTTICQRLLAGSGHSPDLFKGAVTAARQKAYLMHRPSDNARLIYNGVMAFNPTYL